MMPVRIRPASIHDAEAIARLTTELGYPSDPVDMKGRLDVLLARNSQYIAVAEDSSEIIGWVAVELRLLLESGDRAEIIGLVVSPADRRRGVGSALVSEAEEWARRRGHRVIGVRSNVARTEAHPFYERLGYVRAKTQHAYRKELGAG